MYVKKVTTNACKTLKYLLSNIKSKILIFYFKKTKEEETRQDQENETGSEVTTEAEVTMETDKEEASEESSTPSEKIVCSAAMATKIHMTIVKVIIPQLQKVLTEKVATIRIGLCGCLDLHAIVIDFFWRKYFTSSLIQEDLHFSQTHEDIIHYRHTYELEVLTNSL